MAPKKAGEKLRDDQVFDIVTGYYPEIAASVHYKSAKGKGQAGIKHIRKRGFSDQTIERERTKGLASGTGLEALFSGLPMKETKGTVLGAEGTTMEGKNLWQRKTGLKDDPAAIWYKFTGGGDMYKLYGDMVWYMHGLRPRDKIDLLTDYVNSHQFGDKTPQFGQIYSAKESKLVEEAIALASDIFKVAIDAVDEQLKEADYTGHMSAEEMGYEADSFEYISRGDLLAKISSGEIPDPNGEIAAQLEMVSGSMANPRDLYKIRDGQIELMQDVTEMPIDQKGQHGITQLPKTLIDAIKEVKKGSGAYNISKLRQGVAAMYTKAIKDDYNPVISDMKKLLPKNLKKGDKTWARVLKEVNATAGKGGKTTTGTAEIGKALGQHMAKYKFMQTGNKAAKQTAIELVAHVLGTMNNETTARFRQSHRVHTYKPSGISVYATADLTPDPATWLFKHPVAEKSIGIVEGYTVTLAQEKLARDGIEGNGLATTKMQKHMYSGTKVTGMMANGTSVSSCTATMGISKGLRPTTAVHIPAAKDLEEAIIGLLTKEGIPDITSLVGAQGSKLQQRMYGLGKSRATLATGRKANQTQFWALPYIGVLQSEFIDK